MNLPEDDPKKRCPDISLAKKLLNLSPKISLVEGLKPTVEWFRKSLKLLTTTAKTPSGSENYILRTRLEELDLHRFDYGRSGCREATVSWWVKSNKTGTYSNQWYLKRYGSGDISMTRSYTIDAANTWEKKTAVIPVYTTSFTHVPGTSCGIMMDWHLSSGPDDITGAFSWTGQGAARAVTGQVNILDTVNNYLLSLGKDKLSNDAIVDHPEVIKLFSDEIDRLMTSFSSYETVKKFKLLSKQFSIEKGEMTPKMSIVRKKVIENYIDLIETIYN